MNKIVYETNVRNYRKTSIYTGKCKPKCNPFCTRKCRTNGKAREIKKY